MHPCHSHKKGKFGLGLGTEVTVKLEDDSEADETATAEPDAAAGILVVGLVEDADVVEVVDDAEGEVGLVIPLPLPLT